MRQQVPRWLLALACVTPWPHSASGQFLQRNMYTNGTQYFVRPLLDQGWVTHADTLCTAPQPPLAMQQDYPLAATNPCCGPYRPLVYALDKAGALLNGGAPLDGPGPDGIINDVNGVKEYVVLPASVDREDVGAAINGKMGLGQFVVWNPRSRKGNELMHQEMVKALQELSCMYRPWTNGSNATVMRYVKVSWDDIAALGTPSPPPGPMPDVLYVMGHMLNRLYTSGVIRSLRTDLYQDQARDPTATLKLFTYNMYRDSQFESNLLELFRPDYPRGFLGWALHTGTMHVLYNTTTFAQMGLSSLLPNGPLNYDANIIIRNANNWTWANFTTIAQAVKDRDPLQYPIEIDVGTHDDLFLLNQMLFPLWRKSAGDNGGTGDLKCSLPINGSAATRQGVGVRLLRDWLDRGLVRAGDLAPEPTTNTNMSKWVEAWPNVSLNGPPPYRGGLLGEDRPLYGFRFSSCDRPVPIGAPDIKFMLMPGEQGTTYTYGAAIGRNSTQGAMAYSYIKLLADNDKQYLAGTAVASDTIPANTNIRQSADTIWILPYTTRATAPDLGPITTRGRFLWGIAGQRFRNLGWPYAPPRQLADLSVSQPLRHLLAGLAVKNATAEAARDVACRVMDYTVVPRCSLKDHLVATIGPCRATTNTIPVLLLWRPPRPGQTVVCRDDDIIMPPPPTLECLYPERMYGPVLALQIVAGTAAFLTLACTVGLVVLRKHPMVAAMHHLWAAAGLTGCLLVFAALLILPGPPDRPRLLAGVWLLALGWGLTFSSLLARALHGLGAPRAAIGIVALSIAIEIIILAVITGAKGSPTFAPVTRSEQMTIAAMSGGEVVDVTYTRVVADFTPTAAIMALVSINIILVAAVAAGAFASSARRRGGAVYDGRTVLGVSLNALMVGLVVLPSFPSFGTATTTYLVVGAACLAIFLGLVLCVFVPRLLLAMLPDNGNHFAVVWLRKLAVSTTTESSNTDTSQQEGSSRRTGSDKKTSRQMSTKQVGASTADTLHDGDGEEVETAKVAHRMKRMREHVQELKATVEDTRSRLAARKALKDAWVKG